MRIYRNFKESNSITLFNGDCRKLLKRLPDESVDLVVTSPPYCIGKAYEDPHDDIETFRKQHQDMDYTFRKKRFLFRRTKISCFQI